MSDAAAAMDRIYGWQAGVYDVTRRYYMLGRDQLIANLSPPEGAHVLEIGCGTGRNLVKAARRWPQAQFHGIDVSQVMLAKARQAIHKSGLQPRILLAEADATCLDSQALFNVRSYERIYFSYTLSMVPEWGRALVHAADMLAPGGVLFVTDFGDQSGFPRWFRVALRKWLAMFHVTPRDDFEACLRRIAASRGMECDFVPLHGGYSFIAALRRPL
jgi:S-adenosylmethionine-diacylgycerolhomoserine-N-methlytransferase